MIVQSPFENGENFVKNRGVEKIKNTHSSDTSKSKEHGFLDFCSPISKFEGFLVMFSLKLWGNAARYNYRHADRAGNLTNRENRNPLFVSSFLSKK